MVSAMHGNARLVPWFNAHVGLDTEDCIICPHVSDGNPYPRALIDGKRVKLHRLACEMQHGPAPVGRPFACHRCGRPECINGRHLYWGTHAENMADKRQHGTRQSGESHTASKLTWADVIEMRRRHAAGQSTRSLATDFGIAVSGAWNICNYRTWKGADQ